MKYFSFALILLILITGACSAPTFSPLDSALAETATALVRTDRPTATQEPPTSPVEQTPAPSAVSMPSPTLSAILLPSLSPTPGASATTPLPTATDTPVPSTATPLPTPELARSLRLRSPVIQGEDVKQLQTWLLALGYTIIVSADGNFNSLTDAAVREFQKSRDLPADGIVDQDTWTAIYLSAMIATAPTSPPPTVDPNFQVMHRGDSGPRVLEVQNRLTELGYPICELTAYFDLQTRIAVQLFQIENGLMTDGAVGSPTWSTLMSAYARPMARPPVTDYQFTSNYELSAEASALAFDTTHLWFTANGQVIKFDPAAMQIVSALKIPSLGMHTSPSGIRSSIEFTPTHIIPFTRNNMIWLAGRYGYGAGPDADTAFAINSKGNRVVEPALFPGLDNGIRLYDMVVVNNEIWAFHGVYGETSLYGVDSVGGIVPMAYMGWDFAETTAYTWDGRRLWGLIASEGYPLAPVDVFEEKYGAVLGPCGSDLTWDGQWLWVLQDDRLLAYDFTGNLKAVALPPINYEINEIAAGNGYVAAAASDNGRNYIILFQK